MKRLILALALAALPVVAAQAQTYPEARRIVAIGGPVTELIFALGAGDRVIARDTTSTYPEEVNALPDVGYMRQLSAEGVLSVDPDLIVTRDTAGPLEALEMSDWREGFELKVWGYIHLCKLYVPYMKARGSGTVINIIGMGGRAVSPGYIVGAAGNAALIGFTNALGADTPGHNVRVFGINPARTLTDRMTDLLRQQAEQELGDADRWEELIDPAAFPFGRRKAPEEVAALAVMLASPHVHYLSGTVVDMDGGGQWAT